MQERYNQSMANKRRCTVASSSRGTADSAGAEGSGSPSMTSASAASSATAASATAVRPYDRPIHRSPGDDGFEMPSMTEEEADTVTGGFMAVGGVRNMVKALEKALSVMGAEVCRVWDRLVCVCDWCFSIYVYIVSEGPRRRPCPAWMPGCQGIVLGAFGVFGRACRYIYHIKRSHDQPSSKCDQPPTPTP